MGLQNSIERSDSRCSLIRHPLSKGGSGIAESSGRLQHHGMVVPKRISEQKASTQKLSGPPKRDPEIYAAPTVP